MEGKKSAKEVLDWTVGLFHQKDTADFKFSEDVWDWFLNVVICAYEKAEIQLVKRMILIKIIHTREVVRAGFDISKAEDKFRWNDWQVGTVCLLHDVARFDQALLRSFSDEETGFDHAKIGAKMVEDKAFEDFNTLNIDKTSVVEAVKHHSEYRYDGNDIYGKLVRDADKLALLRAMPEILATNIGGFSEEGVTEAALKAYKEGKIVRHVDMKTRADMFLAWLAWENDFNFAETKKLFVSEGMKEWMLGELKSRGVEV